MYVVCQKDEATGSLSKRRGFTKSWRLGKKTDAAEEHEAANTLWMSNWRAEAHEVANTLWRSHWSNAAQEHEVANTLWITNWRS